MHVGSDGVQKKLLDASLTPFISCSPPNAWPLRQLWSVILNYTPSIGRKNRPETDREPTYKRLKTTRNDDRRCEPSIHLSKSIATSSHRSSARPVPIHYELGARQSAVRRFFEPQASVLGRNRTKQLQMRSIGRCAAKRVSAHRRAYVLLRLKARAQQVWKQFLKHFHHDCSGAGLCVIPKGSGSDSRDLVRTTVVGQSRFLWSLPLPSG